MNSFFDIDAIDEAAEDLFTKFKAYVTRHEIPISTSTVALIMVAAEVAVRANLHFIPDDEAAREQAIEHLIKLFADRTRQLVREPTAPHKGRMH